MLRDELVEVHPVAPDPGRQCRKEQRVLVGVVGDQLFPIPVVELPHSRQPATPVVGLQGRNRGHESRAIDPQGLMDEIDKDEIGLGSVGAHSESRREAACRACLANGRSLTLPRAVDGLPTTQIREERRRPPRLSGRRRRPARPGADRELGASRRGVLGDPGAGAPAPAAGGHRAPDHLRPAGNRPVRSGAPRSSPRSRDPGRRHLRSHGCRRARSRPRSSASPKVARSPSSLPRPSRNDVARSCCSTPRPG